MKLRILGSLLAVTFVFGAMSSADAGLFFFKKKSNCCKVEKVECCEPVECAPKCEPVKCEPVKCTPAPTCCSPKPTCCGSGHAAAAPAATEKGAPKATDAPPAPPSGKKEAPKPKQK